MKDTMKYQDRKQKNWLYRHKELKFYSFIIKAFYKNGMIEEKYRITISFCTMICLSILMFTSNINQIHLQPIALLYLCACLSFMVVILISIRIYHVNKIYILQIVEEKELTDNKKLKKLDTISNYLFLVSNIFSFIFLFLFTMAYIK